MDLIALVTTASQANFGIIPTITLIAIYFKLSKQTALQTDKLVAALASHHEEDKSLFSVNSKRLDKLESHIGIGKLKEI